MSSGLPPESKMETRVNTAHLSRESECFIPRHISAFRSVFKARCLAKRHRRIFRVTAREQKLSLFPGFPFCCPQVGGWGPTTSAYIRRGRVHENPATVGRLVRGVSNRTSSSRAPWSRKFTGAATLVTFFLACFRSGREVRRSMPESVE